MRNLELEEAIRRAPGDLDAYEVYADWLLEHGVAHGELIAFAVRRRRAGADATTSFAALAAEARLLQDRTRMFGAIGTLPRELLEIDLELGFFRAVRVYAAGDDAGLAVRGALSDRAGMLLEELAVLDKARAADPFLAEDRRTAKAIWSVLETHDLPSSLTAIALPLVAAPPQTHFDRLSRIARATFPLRSVASVATHVERLGALTALTLTTSRYLDEVMVDALLAHAPAFAAVPQVTLRTGYTPAAHRPRLREALPQLAFG